MRKLFSVGTLATILGLIFAFGAIDAAAQKRKPVIRKKPVARRAAIVRAPALYRVDTGTTIRVRMSGTLSSKTARAGDRFKTTVTEPVYSTNGVVVIPVGSTINGRVDTVTPSRKSGKPGEISVSFISVQLPNGTVRAINGSLTDLNTKDAKSDNESTASGDKMKYRKPVFIGGGAGGGAIIGGAVGGGKGALIGGIIGGIAGAIAENQTKGEEAEVRSGTEFSVYLNQSISMAKWSEPIN
jgi:hypothetical protein